MNSKLTTLFQFNCRVPFTFNKNFETECYYHQPFINYFNWSLLWSRHTHHAGLYFQMELFGLNFNWSLYDTRHWNHFTSQWEDDLDNLEFANYNPQAL